jgi:hypothetical protein
VTRQSGFIEDRSVLTVKLDQVLRTLSLGAKVTAPVHQRFGTVRLPSGGPESKVLMLELSFQALEESFLNHSLEQLVSEPALTESRSRHLRARAHAFIFNTCQRFSNQILCRMMVPVFAGQSIPGQGFNIVPFAYARVWTLDLEDNAIVRHAKPALVRLIVFVEIAPVGEYSLRFAPNGDFVRRRVYPEYVRERLRWNPLP